MAFQLPATPEVRAILVGIEHYPHYAAGTEDLDGACKGAIQLATWLLRRGVRGSQIQLWTAVRDHQAFVKGLPPEMAEVDQRRFEWQAFQDALIQPGDGWEAGQGSFLIVYVCGHGLTMDHEAVEHLLLPDSRSEADQLRALSFLHWRRHMCNREWQHYDRQLWVIDACRDPCRPRKKPAVEGWAEPAPQSVGQYVVQSCSSGQVAALDPEGPRFSRLWIGALDAMPRNVPPDFEKACELAALELQRRGDPDAPQQTPSHFKEGLDPHGNLLTRGAVAQLLPLLEQLSWPVARFIQHVTSSRQGRPLIHVPGDLKGLLRHLDDLPEERGVAPLLAFAWWIGLCTGRDDIKVWVRSRHSPQQQAELESRTGPGDCVRYGLSIWVDDKPKVEVRQPEHFCRLYRLTSDHEHSVGEVVWREVYETPLETAESLRDFIGSRVTEAFGRPDVEITELTLELFLPKKWLQDPRAIEHQKISVADDDQWIGRDIPVILHAADRLKSATHRVRLNQRGRLLLKLLDEQLQHQVKTITDGDSLDQLARLDWSELPSDAEVWMAFDALNWPSDARTQPLSMAIKEGWPTLVWMRACPTECQAHHDPVAAWPDWRQALRGTRWEVAANMAGWRRSGKDHRAAHVALLLDDPARMDLEYLQLQQPRKA